jgi:hypothetical protein
MNVDDEINPTDGGNLKYLCTYVINADEQGFTSSTRLFVFVKYLNLISHLS